MNYPINHFLKFRLHKQSGYTIVEVLVASALLAGVLIPALLFIGRFRMQSMQKNRIVAMQLAREEMERITASALFEPQERKVSFDNKDWLIKREISDWMGLTHVRVLVLRPISKRVMAELETYRVRE